MKSRAQDIAPDHLISTPRGFTLIEMLTVLAIASIFAGLSASAMGPMISRVRGTRSITDLISALRHGPRMATAQNADIWIGVEDPGTGTAPYSFVMILDWNGNFDITAFDPANPSASFDSEGASGKRADRLMAQGEFYDNVRFYAGSTLAAATVASMPALFKPPLQGSSGSCTVYTSSSTGCAVEAVNKMAWIRFLRNGEVRVPGDPDARYVTFILGLDNAGDRSEKTAVLIALPHGLVEIYDDA